MEETTGAAVVDAPASTPDPASTPTTAPSVEKHSSFAEALTARMAATTTADPGVPQPVGEQPAAATAPPPQPETPPVETVSTPESQGPIPFVNHKRILDNTRVKTEAEVTQRFREQYGTHVALGEKFDADPVGTAVGVIQALSEDPNYGPQIISALARTLGARRGGQQAAVDQEPQADLQSGDGTLVYSAERLAEIRKHDRDQILKEVDQRLQPLQTREQHAQARERHEAATKGATDRMSKVLAPFQQLPEFKEHKPAIAAKVKTLLDEGIEPGAAVGLAFTQVLRETVLPSRTAQSQQQLTATAVQKSLGSTSGPGAAPAAPAGRPKSFEEGFSRVRV